MAVFPAQFPLASLGNSITPPSTGYVLEGIDGFGVGTINFDGDKSGWSVAGLGDIDGPVGPGFTDVVIGAPEAGQPPGGGTGTSQNSDAGEVYIVLGEALDDLDLENGSPADGVIDLADLTVASWGYVLKGIDPLDTAGFSVAGAGDVTGDGTPDILVGAPGGDPGGVADAGESYILSGAPADLDALDAADGSADRVLDAALLDGTTGVRLDGVFAGDASGSAVSAAGDVNGDGIADALVGAPYLDWNGTADAGGAYVVFGAAPPVGATVDLGGLLGGGTGNLIQALDAGDRLGSAVSPLGDVDGDGFDDILVGAPLADPGGRAEAGETHVVFGSASSFLLDTPTIDGTNGYTLAGIDPGDRSGTAVGTVSDLNGNGLDEIVIGADGGGVGLGVTGGQGDSPGEAYLVFTDQLAALDLANAQPAGTTDGRIDLGDLDGTTGYVFEGTGQLANAGLSVSDAGDIDNDGTPDLIIGAPFAGPSGSTGAGRSYVVFGDRLADLDAVNGTDGVIELAILETATGQADHGFAINGIDGLAGSYSADQAGYAVSGPGDVTGDGIDDLLVGARFAESGGQIQSGETYVIAGRDSTNQPPGLQCSLAINGIGQDDRSGWSVSAAGDVNGDGLGDVIIGAPLADSTGAGAPLTDGGQAYVVFGDAGWTPGDAIDLATLDGTNGFVIDGGGPGDQLGHAVSGIGDVNGDGLDDVLVGAPRSDPSNPEAGESYVVHGSTAAFPAAIPVSTLDGTNGFAIEGTGTGDSSGHAVAGAGDLNDDGTADLAVGIPGADPSGAGSGQGYALYGSAAGFPARVPALPLAPPMTPTPGLLLDGAAAGDDAGVALAPVGDVNGDGDTDLLIGAPGADAGGTGRGATYLVFGEGGLVNQAGLDLGALDGTQGYILRGILDGDTSGYSVAGGGDVDGDGVPDMLIGAPGAAGTAGEAYLVRGGAANLATLDGNGDGVIELGNLDGTTGYVLTGIDPSDRAGLSVSIAGDLDGGGQADLLIGAPRAGGGMGESYVVFGETLATLDAADTSMDGEIDLDLLNGATGVVLKGAGGNDRSGFSVSAAGDVNGDGADDLIVGEPGADPATTQPVTPFSGEGQSHILFGGACFLTGQPEIDLLALVDGETNLVPNINRGLTVRRDIPESISRDELRGPVGPETRLKVLDPDDPPEALTYFVTQLPEHGALLVDGVPLTAERNTFTQAALNDGRVVYDNDGSAASADGFEFSVLDPSGAGPRDQTFEIAIEPEPGAPIPLPDAPISIVEEVALFFEIGLGRPPLPPGLTFWTKVRLDHENGEGGLDSLGLAREVLESAEFSANVGDPDGFISREFVEVLFRNVLKREGADAGIDFWTGRLDGTIGDAAATQEQVLRAFAASPENRDKVPELSRLTFDAEADNGNGQWVFDPDPNLGETLTGTPGDDFLRGLGGDDTLNGLEGDDEFFDGAAPQLGNTGSDVYDGGPGIDTVIYEAPRSAFTFSVDPGDDGMLVVTGGPDSDRLQDIETIRFISDTADAATGTFIEDVPVAELLAGAASGDDPGGGDDGAQIVIPETGVQSDDIPDLA